ncbi:MAG: alpha/beta hydrolase [Bacteroidales bacterium]|nr:alpha/beta hydrolase [Bacteroidales bacterium]
MTVKGTMETDGFVMDYFSFGSGSTPFVLIPGVSAEPVTSMAEVVAQQYKLFHEDYVTWLFDRKRDFEDGYSIEAMADDTAKAMKRLSISNACVMGSSQGGMIALYLAAKYPELVSKLVLCCTAASTDDIDGQTLQEWVRIAESGDSESLYRAYYHSIYSESFVMEYAEAIEAAVRTATPEGLHRLMELTKACLNFDARPLLADIRCDCLVVGSRIDKVLGYRAAARLAETLDCRTVIYNQYGHAAIDEAPDLKEKMLAFLKG